MSLWIICDEKGAMARIANIKVCGRLVEIPAIFTTEEDALAIAFKVEEISSIKHQAMKCDGSITVSPA